MAIKTLRVFQEFTSEGYVPMPIAGNIDYGVTVAGTFPGTTPATYQTDDPDIDVTLTVMTDYYVWIRSHGAEWNPNYTRNVRVYPDSALINNVVMGIIIAGSQNGLPVGGTAGQILSKVDADNYDTQWIDNILDNLKDVVIATPTNNQGLVYETSTLLWKNKAIQLPITLTTTGSSGASTFVGNALNIPTYTLVGLGGVPTTRTLSINGTLFDLSANRVWNVGTVTSVSATVPTGFAISGSPITTSGTLAISFASGYSLPTDGKQAQWDVAYNKRIDSFVYPIEFQSNILSIYQSSPTSSGYLSSADYTTFNSKQSALNGTGFVKASGTTISYDNSTYVPTSRTITINGVTYDLSANRSWTVGGSLTATAPLSITSDVISITQSSATVNGYLSSTDWSTFNAKQTALSGTGFVKVAGTTVSYDNTAYTPAARLLTINGTAYDLTADRSWTISAGSGMRNVQTFTATANQTTFTITGGYTVGLVDVYVNGARLSTSDYTATNGTSVVLGVGVVANDIVDFVSYTASLSSGINGSGTTNYVPKFTASNVLGNSLIFDNGTNVGIGNASPTAKLHVTGTILASSTVTASSLIKSGGTSAQILMADGSVITAGTNITISGGVISASGGGAGSFLPLAGGTMTGMITSSTVEALRMTQGGGYISGWNAANTTRQGYLQFSGTSTILASEASTSLSLSTQGSIRMLISTSGNIGIGTVAPSYKLQITEAAWNGSNYSIYANGYSYFDGLRLNGADAERSIYQLNNTSLGFATSGSQPIIFSTSVTSERMRISSSGTLLVGKSSTFSNEKLAVTGSTNIWGVAQFENNVNQADVNHGILNLVNTRSTYAIGNDASIMFSAFNSTSSMQPRASIGMLVASDLGGHLVFNTRNDSASGERMRITSTGFIGIGTTAPATNLHINTSSDTVIRLSSTSGAYSSGIQMYAAGAGAGFISSNQSIYVTANANGVYLPTNGVTWVSNSDLNLKNIESYIENAIESIMDLEAIKFNWKGDSVKRTNIGLIAQQVEKVYPELINKNREGYLGVRYTELIPVLIQAIKELNAKIEAK